MKNIQKYPIYANEIELSGLYAFVLNVFSG